MVVSRIKQIKGMNSWEDPATLPEGVVKLAENMKPNKKAVETREGLVKWGEVVTSVVPVTNPAISVTVGCTDGFNFTDPIVPDIPYRAYGTVENTGDTALTGVIVSLELTNLEGEITPEPNCTLYWTPTLWSQDEFPEGPPEKSLMSGINLAVGVSTYFYSECFPQPDGHYYLTTATVMSSGGTTAEAQSDFCLYDHE
jgi:hypothetical protein